MKKLLPLLVLAIAVNCFSQDTTSLRMVACGYDYGTVFLKNDTTELVNIDATSDKAGVSIFMRLADSLLYVLAVDDYNAANRDLYRLDPFTDTKTLFHDFGTTHLASADITDDGDLVYMLVGNGGTTPAQLISFDMATSTETVLTTVPDLGGAQTSFIGEYHEPDSSLYIYEYVYLSAVEADLHKVDLSTLTSTTSSTVGWTSDYVKAAYWTGVPGEFFVNGGWSNQYYTTDATSENLTAYDDAVSLSDYGDLTMFHTIRKEADTVGFCDNMIPDSTMISLIYNTMMSYTWYRDDTPLAETNDTLWASAAGTYRCLYQIDAMSYMWSEPVVVEHWPISIPTITSTGTDTLICPGDTITLSGLNEVSMQWYMNGSMIAGATGDTYDATAAGVYNQLVTNSYGCTDSAWTSYVIYDDPNCGASIAEDVFSIDIYPNPVQNTLNIQSTSTIKSISIVDLSGRKVARFDNVAATSKQIDFEKMTSGIYLVKVKTEQGELTSKIVK